MSLWSCQLSNVFVLRNYFSNKITKVPVVARSYHFGHFLPMFDLSCKFKNAY